MRMFATETRNRLFIIDGKQVLRDHAGPCSEVPAEFVAVKAVQGT